MNSDQLALQELALFLLDDDATSPELHNGLQQISEGKGFEPESALLGADHVATELLDILELQLHETANIQSEAQGNSWLETNLVSLKGEDSKFQVWFLLGTDY